MHLGGPDDVLLALLRPPGFPPFPAQPAGFGQCRRIFARALVAHIPSHAKYATNAAAETYIAGWTSRKRRPSTLITTYATNP